MKKSVSFVMAALMAASLATTGSMTVLADGDVTITVFNSKTEVESQLEEAAAEFRREGRKCRNLLQQRPGNRSYGNKIRFQRPVYTEHG